MRKAILIPIILLLSLIVINIACSKEPQNIFTEIPEHNISKIEVKINGELLNSVDTIQAKNIYKTNKTSINVEVGDIINIILYTEIEGSFKAEYKWDIFEPASIKDPITNEFPKVREIGKDKELKFKVTGAPVINIIRCTVKNTLNGTEDVLLFAINIEKPSGYAIIYNNEKGGDFDFFKSPSNTLEYKNTIFYRNVFSASNGFYIQNPQSLIAISGWTGKSLYSFNMDNIMELNSNTYKVISKDINSFFQIKPPNHKKSYCINKNSYSFGVFDGEIYFSNSEMKFAYSLDPQNKYKNIIIANERVNISKSYFLFFDETNHRFRYGNYNGKIFSFTTANGSIFDINDTKMNLIYAEAGYEGNINAIMKDKFGQFFYCVMDLKYGLKMNDGKEQETVKALRKIDISTIPGFKESSKWAIHNRAPISFFSSENSLYTYNYDSNIAKKILETNHKINFLKVFKHTNESLNGKTLYVGTWDGKYGYLYEINYNVLTGEIIGNPTIYKVNGEIIELKYI